MKYWSPELCFVSTDQRTKTRHVASDQRRIGDASSAECENSSFPVSAATKPNDVFFRVTFQSEHRQRLEQHDLQACEQAKTLWTQATSRKEEGLKDKIDVSRDADAFPAPKWPTQSLGDLIGKTFAGRLIESEDHPGLLRLIGAKQSVS